MEITFNPSKKQYLAYLKLTDSKTNFVGYGGSAFSGKSYLMCYWLTIMAVGYPETAWGLGRKELTTLKKTTLVTLFKVFGECKMEVDKDYVYNQQLNVITFTHNQSKIYLIDTAYKPSDPLYQRFGGYELTGCAIDESAETDEKAIQILFTRCGRKNNDKYKLLAKVLETFNPNKNHVYRRYYLPSINKQLKDSYCFIKALPSDNPSPEVEQYIQNIINNSDKTTIQRLVYGNFEYDEDPNALIEYDNILHLFNNYHLLDEIDEGFITADIARMGSDASVVGLWKGLSLTKIYTYTKQTLDITAKEIIKIQQENKIKPQNIIIDATGVGAGVKDMVRGSIEFNSAARPFNDEKFENLKTQCYFKLAEIINNQLLFINEEQPQIRTKIIEELEQVKRDKVESDNKIYLLGKDQVKRFLGRSPDYSDMLMMRMWYLVQNKQKRKFSVTSF